MSFNRRRNIYTLGDFHQQQPLKALSRRQNSDPFERDPFKIQSYNFRYADRPTFPLQDLGNRSSNPQNNNHTTVKRFETFFYNHDFAPTRYDKENNSTNKFHEFRRRKFLYDHQQAAPVQQPTHNQQHQQTFPTTHQLLSQQARTTNMFRPATAITTTTCGAAGTSAAYGASTSRQNLSGLRALHAVNATVNSASVGVGQQQQKQQQQRQQQQQQQRQQQHQQSQTQQQPVRSAVDASSSKISLAGCGSSSGLRRLYNEPQANSSNTSNTSNTNNVSNSNSLGDKVSSSLPRLSASQHNRKPLQALHIPAKHVVNTRGSAAIERKLSTCSGCRININIKGLDETQLGENLTINIEADPSKNHYNHAQMQQQQQQQQQQLQKQQEQQRVQQLKQQELTNNLTRIHKPLKEMQKSLNITRSGSSNCLVVDKHISKTSLSSTSNRQPARRLEPRSEKDFKPISPFVVPHRPTVERVPSIVPFNLEKKNIRDCFAKENANPQAATINEVHRATERPLNQMRFARNSYNAALNDLKTLNNYEKLLRARASGMPSTPITATPMSMPTTRSLPMKAEHKLLNIPTAANRKYEVIMSQNCEPPRRSKRLDSLSRLSLRSPTEKCSHSTRSFITQCRSSETQFSSGRQNPQHFQSRRSLSPVSVNINVYADKLKLLRV